MKRTLLTITFSFFCLFLLAQNAPPRFKSNADSLQFTFTHATTDTAKLSILLNEQAAKYLMHIDLVLDLYNQGILLAQKVNDKKSLARLYLKIGNLYAIGKKDEGIAFIWFQKALQEAEKIDYTVGCALIHYAMALVYDHQGFQDKMFQSFDKSVIYTERGYKPILLSSLTSIQEVYAANNRLDKAYELGKKAIGFIEQHEHEHYLEDKIYTYSSFIEILKRMPNKQIDIKYCSDKMIQLLKEVDMTDDAGVLYHAVFACFEINQTALALQYAEKLFALKVEDNSTISKKTDIHLVLAEYYEKQKNYPLSIQHYKDYMVQHKSALKQIITEEAGRKVIKAESERDLAIKQKEVEEHKLYTLVVSLIALLVFALGGVAYYFYRREQKQKAELTRLNATKDRLFALLSHDLLSPIAYLKNIMMLVDWDLMSADEFKKTTKDLTIKVNNLYGMFENVLHWSISQMRGIKAKREKVVIKGLIEEQIGLLEPIAKGKGITMTHNIPADFECMVDKNHIALILRNLLQNALKFTNKGGSILFICETIPPLGAGGTVGSKKLIIQDNGIGMTPDILAQLFKIDENTNREGTNKEGGTGLGLILTKELVELNGGTIVVDSEIGKGTTFTLTFS